MSDVIEAIKAEYARDVAEAKPAIQRSDVPLSYELIRPEWFTATLCSASADAKVVSFDLGPPDDGSSNRRQVMTCPPLVPRS